ncbi:MAG: stage 0 sporulation family protein [Phycisphaerales bacterium]
MSIFPLQQFEDDLEAARHDQEVYDRLKAPTSIVVRFGAMKLIGEFPYKGDAKPGCGSKLVVRTHRGTELGEMLTSTCPNAGCSKSVTRQEMLEYIENSGGRDYPFHTEGRVIRVATIEDLNEQSRLDAAKLESIKTARRHAEALDLPMKIVEAEPILGGERLTFYFTSEGRVDFRDLVRALADEFRTRIELRQVGARDEARLTADYERCGQYCCCKNFLKVLKPVSMRSAKTQKATLDPLKISGRCGRLMCCLRYEDETYETLRKKLPRRKKRVGTPEGPGIVLDTQILTQLVLVRLEATGAQVAVPVEELGDPDAPPPPKAPDPLRGLSEKQTEERADDRKRRRRGRRSKGRRQDEHRDKSQREPSGQKGGDDAPKAQGDQKDDAAQGDQSERKPRRRRRRGRGRGRGRGPNKGPGGDGGAGGDGGGGAGGGD